MNQADRDRRLRAVFDEALLQEPSTRSAYLDHACAGDPELRPEVMRLLAAHEDTRSVLEPATGARAGCWSQRRSGWPVKSASPAPDGFECCDGWARVAWASSMRSTTECAT